MSIIIDIDIIIGRMLDALDFEEKIFLGERLGVDTDFSCVLDDMYPDRIAEMETEIGDELYKLIETPITEYPDVQRLVGQVVELQAENKRLKEALRIAKDALSADADLYLPAYHNSKDIATIKKEAEVALVNIDKAERTNQ